MDTITDTTGVDRSGEPAPGTAGTVTVSLTIENTYELYEDVTTYAVDRVVPAPPCGPADDADAFNEWAHEHIYQFTGTGHTRGDSWYDVEITASSEPALIGHTFEFGY